ncbi:MAG: phosphate ABC transporter permease subunit PstC, partial [Acidobacteriaceae bacterium]|nr:phosphate ABC transporter permease subunit PstC [Acidobacteriaceae bacterium]
MSGAVDPKAMLNPREATPQVRPAEASATSKVQLRAPNKVADQVFRLLVLACGLSLLAIVGLIIIQLLEHSSQSWHAFGFKFFTGQNWDPVQGDFGGLSFVYGTLVSSLLALILAVPVAIGVAVFTTEMCPKPIRGVLSFFTELLAAIPSVIYGLWAIFVLAPLLRNKVEPFLAHYLGWTGLFTGAPYGIGMLAAGVILAIMIVPIIS